MRVPVAVGEARPVDDHGVIEQGRIAFFDALQLAHPLGELLHVIGIDLRDFLNQIRLAAMMRERVMAVGIPISR